MFAQFFAALFSYPFKTVYGKALPRMVVYCHFETAPLFFIFIQENGFSGQFYAVFAHNPPPRRPFSVFMRISI